MLIKYQIFIWNWCWININSILFNYSVYCKKKFRKSWFLNWNNVTASVSQAGFQAIKLILEDEEVVLAKQNKYMVRFFFSCSIILAAKTSITTKKQTIKNK